MKPDYDKTCKDAVLENRPNAVCVRTESYWEVRDGAEVLAVSGRGPSYAWRIADEWLHQQ